MEFCGILRARLLRPCLVDSVVEPRQNNQNRSAIAPAFALESTLNLAMAAIDGAIAE